MAFPGIYIILQLFSVIVFCYYSLRIRIYLFSRAFGTEYCYPLFDTVQKETDYYTVHFVMHNSNIMISRSVCLRKFFIIVLIYYHKRYKNTVCI